MKPFKTLLRVFLSFGLIGLLIYLMRNDLGKIKETLLNANIYIFLLAFILYVGVIVIASFRLKWVVKVQNARISLVEAASLNLVGNFFSFFLPTAIGGDVVKAHFCSQRTNNKLGSYTAVFVDRFLGLITIVFIACFAILFFGNDICSPEIYPKVRFVTFLLLALSIIVAIFLLNRNLAKKFSFLRSILRFLKLDSAVETVYNALNIYKNHPYVIIKSLLLSLFIQLSSFYMIYILAKALYMDIPLKLVFFAMPLVSFMSMLPSIGGLGFRESAFVVFFGILISKDKAFALGLMWLGVVILISVLGGIIYAVKGDFRVKLDEEV